MRFALPGGPARFVAVGCSSPAAPNAGPGATQRIFDEVSPSVVAVLNDIQAQHDAEAARAEGAARGRASLALATANPSPGHRVWALGHTGAGLWALSWGVSEGTSPDRDVADGGDGSHSDGQR